MCNKCKNSGLVPFVNRRGKTIPGAFLHCSCHPVYGDEGYQSGALPTRGHRPYTKRGSVSKGKLRVYHSDFDFPCSELFRGYYDEVYAEHPMDIIPPSERQKPEPKVIYRTRPSGELESIKGQVLYLQEKLLKHITPKKQVNKPQEYGDISV